jgi:hypothetical protein
MGYEHYLWRPPELDLGPWREWVGDVRLILANLPTHVPQTYYPLDGDTVMVRAPLVITGPVPNTGRRQLNDSRVAFNGGGWVEVGGQPQRLWGGCFVVDRVYALPVPDLTLDDPYGDFEPRPDERGWWCDSYKTNHRPYDLPVTACLIRLAHRFPEGVQVSTDGGQEDWRAGLDLCRQMFGDAELPFAVHGSPRLTVVPGRLDELLAKRGAGQLAPHDVGELRDLLARDLEIDQSAGRSAEVGGQEWVDRCREQRMRRIAGLDGSPASQPQHSGRPPAGPRP